MVTSVSLQLLFTKVFVLTIVLEALNILHPSVLILTRLQRWSVTRRTPWRETVTKIETDKRDIDFLIHWLAEHSLVIAFDLYKGHEKSDFLLVVRHYYDAHIDRIDHAVDTQLIVALKNVLTPGDLEALLAINVEAQEDPESDLDEFGI